MAHSPRKAGAQAARRARSPGSTTMLKRAPGTKHTDVDDKGDVAARADKIGKARLRIEQNVGQYSKVMMLLETPGKKKGGAYFEPSSIEIHEFISKGLPGEMLITLAKKVQFIAPADVSNALGVSVRTLQRRSHAPKSPLSKEQSGRAWKFAEILATATEVFGSQSEAEQWMIAPAIALDQRRPIDLLGSPVGLELVEQLLGRIEHGIYT